MRSVTLQISKLLLNVGDEIELQLLNCIGDPLVTFNGFSLNSKFTLGSDTFEISLLENEKIGSASSYKITIVATGIHFYFSVPISTDNKPHDMLALFKIGCFKDMFDDDFVKKLNNYFTSKKSYFTNKERYLIDIYEYYADEVVDSTSTIDIAKEMDEYLATKLPIILQIGAV